MIQVHHLDRSRSHRILWTLGELGLEYELVVHLRNPRTLMAPEALKKIHPLGKSPVIVDADQVIAESGAILEYLVEKYGPHLKPAPSSKEWMNYVYWMHYAEGSLMPPLVLNLIFGQIQKQPVPFFIKPIVSKIVSQVMKGYILPQTQLHLDFVESILEKQNWFAGSEFSAADIQMSFPLEAAEARGQFKEKHVKIKHFLKTIRSRKSYLQALEKGGPVTFS